MSITLQIFVIIAGVVLILLVLRDTAHWKMTEKQSLFWIFSGVVLTLTGIFPSLAVIPAIFFWCRLRPFHYLCHCHFAADVRRLPLLCDQCRPAETGDRINRICFSAAA